MKEERVGCKIALEVGEAAGRVLDSQSKICNWLYNHLLEQANTLKAEFKSSNGRNKEAARQVYSKRGLRDLVPGFKMEHPFLRAVHSSPLKNTALRLSEAIREYQKSRRGERGGGHTVNWPQFRSWKRKWFSLLYDEPWKGYAVEGRDLRLSLGVDEEGQRLTVTLRLAEPLPYVAEQVRGLRILKEVGHFYAVFTVSPKLPPLQIADRVIALDPNHKNLVYGVGVDGRAVEVENMSNLRALDRRIDELRSKRDRCRRRSKLVEFTREDGTLHRHWRPSHRWQRYNEALDRLYKLRREQTKTYLYTVSNALCREYDVIAVGHYTPHGGGITTGMRRAMNNQSLIGRFKKAQAWVARRSGKQYIEYDETGTTRTCCLCDTVIEGGIEPHVRQWVCPTCGSTHIRDENAAQNGLRRVLKEIVPRSGHRLVTISERCTWRVAPTGVVSLAGSTLPGGVAVVNGSFTTPSR